MSPRINRGAGLPRLSRHYQHRWQVLWRGRPKPRQLTYHLAA